MSIKEKRLARGWTQTQLAEFSGLSQRTIQRLEKGGPATLETQKCLAAVFESDIAELGIVESVDESRLSDEEKTELENIRELRRFYVEAIAFLIIVPLVCLATYRNDGNLRTGLGLALGWGAWLAWCAFELFDREALMGKAWEKRQLDKRMGRKD